MKQGKIKFKSYIFVLVQFITMGLIIFTGSIKPAGLYLAQLLAGIVLIAWAIWTIKPGNFNVIPEMKENGRLVTSGPYRYIRHPMYTAVLLICLAFVLNDYTITRLLLWVVLLVNLVLKLEYEEEILTYSFFEYPEYKMRTKRLIPYIF